MCLFNFKSMWVDEGTLKTFKSIYWFDKLLETFVKHLRRGLVNKRTQELLIPVNRFRSFSCHYNEYKMII